LVEMRVSRIAADTSVPSTSTVGASGSVPITSGKRWAAAVTASASVRSTPSCRHHQVRARYIAPVSRKP
jgi:hypothetical protein